MLEENMKKEIEALKKTKKHNKRNLIKSDLANIRDYMNKIKELYPKGIKF
jgi:uncharacterized protein YjgD (DUF1641 family)